MTYDENNARVTIETPEELQVYVKQNESAEIQRRRFVRQALRALDVVRDHIQLISRENLSHFHTKILRFELLTRIANTSDVFLINPSLQLSVVSSESNVIILRY